MHTRHRGTTVALACLLGANAVALSGAPASAASRVAVPAGATLMIDGHGYGHGRGMSQYGAEGAARQGLTGQQIARFYYPHTTAGQVGGKVRVLITADTDDNTTVTTRPGLKVRDLASGQTFAVPTTQAAGKADRWRLAPAAGGKTRVSYRNAGWHLWRKLGGEAEFRAPGPIALVTDTGTVTYRGTLQSRQPPGAPATQRVTVDRVSLEGYVQGVVPREMPASWHQAALRAQAIAARTYAAFEAQSSTNHVWNLCDTSHCQVYGGLSAEYPSSNQAVVATAGQVRMYGDAPAFTQFSASNGGWSVYGGQPYLPAQADPYDGWTAKPYHSWSVPGGVPAATVAKKFDLGTLQSFSVVDRDGNGEWGGRVLHLQLVGSKRTVTVTGSDFQAALGLKSTWFDITVAS